MSACVEVCVFFNGEKKKQPGELCFLTPVQLLEMQWTELFHRMTHTPMCMYTQTGRVNWRVVPCYSPHVHTCVHPSQHERCTDSHLKHCCYSGSLLPFVPSLHSHGHTSRQWRCRWYWKWRYEQISFYPSITPASASWCIHRRRTKTRCPECSWGLFFFNPNSINKKRVWHKYTIFVRVSQSGPVVDGSFWFLLCFFFFFVSLILWLSLSLASFVVSNMDKEQRRNSPGEWVAEREWKNILLTCHPSSRKPKLL